ncbi:glutathione S-transferase [Rhizobium sp. FKL33]|uniref:glutathione S-transferase n=1 Tax=Rhizobium sp. FKL33 TaxID=2562307 RepID=UPI0010C10CD1|nr:glutathione S-transferase [Rhizobium sp. FKL33]
MLTVHYLEKSRAHRILWLLEELELDYQVVTYKRGPDYRAPDTLKKVHPLGKSPVLEDEGLVVAESGAILEYLLETYGAGRLKPAVGTAEWARYLYWLHAAEGSAMPPLVMRLVFASIPKRVPFFIRPVAAMISKGAIKSFIDPQLRTQIDYWSDELARGGWFAGGAFTAADIAMSYPVEAALSRLPEAKSKPRLLAYSEAIKARPAYRRAEAKVGDAAGVPS